MNGGREERGGGWVGVRKLGHFTLGPKLLGAAGCPNYIIKRSKCSNRTVTLTQQSVRYSVENYMVINHNHKIIIAIYCYC